MKIEQIKLILDKSFKNLEQTIASCIFYTHDGKYLLQLRDDKNGLPLRNHWALFGGEVEENESEYQAIKREMLEELKFDSIDYRWFHEAVYAFPDHHIGIVRKIYFDIPITDLDFFNMELCEGSEKRLFNTKEILLLDKISPWDISAILLHARKNIIFPK